MRNYRWILWFSAMFVAVALVGFGAESAGEGKAPGRRGPGVEIPAKVMKAASTMVAKLVAKEVGLEGEKADKFISAYVAEREAANTRLAEAVKANDPEARRKVFTDNREKMQAVMEANLSADQAKKAQEMLGFGGLEARVAVLMQAKVEDAKVEQALPILAKYNKASSDLFAKVRSNELSQEDAQAKGKELREAAIKDLTPIVGEENATKALAQGMRGGRKGGGGGGGAEK